MSLGLGDGIRNMNALVPGSRYDGAIRKRMQGADILRVAFQNVQRLCQVGIDCPNAYNTVLVASNDVSLCTISQPISRARSRDAMRTWGTAFHRR